jgi:hypothetical protein
MKPRALGLQEVVVHFGAFDYLLTCVAGPPKNVGRYIAWKFDDPGYDCDLSEARGRFFYRKGWAPVIWIPRKPRTPEEHGTLSHELLHALREMLVDWAGMPLNVDTDEAFCHAMGHGVRTILAGLK